MKLTDLTKEELLKLVVEFNLGSLNTNHNYKNSNIFLVKKNDKPQKYALMDSSRFVLDKEKMQFVYEPFSSSRTEEFLQRTRFDSLDEAYEYFLKLKGSHQNVKK